MINIVKTLSIIVLLSSLIVAENLSLKDAISIGLNSNYNIKLQKNTTQKSDNNKIMATGYLLPQVNLQGGINFTNTNDLLDKTSPTGMAGDNDMLAYNGGVSLNWTLFDGLRMFRARSMIYTQAKQGIVQERIEVENIVMSIIQSYYAVVGNKTALKIMKDQLKISQTRYDRAKLKFQSGTIIGREFLSSEVALNNDKSKLEDAKYRYKTSKYQLNVLLGRDVSKTFEVTDSINIIDLKYSKDEIFKIAMDKNSSIMNLNLSIKLADKMLGIEKSKFSPMVIANGSYGYTKNNISYDKVDVDGENLKGTVGVNLNWNIFNGFADKSGIANKKLDKNNSEISKEMFITQLKSQIYSKWLEYQNYKNKKVYNELSVKSAEKNLTVSTELFNNGSITDVQFREAQVGLSNAKYALIVTKYKLRIIIAELEKMAGVLKI